MLEDQSAKTEMKNPFDGARHGGAYLLSQILREAEVQDHGLRMAWAKSTRPYQKLLKAKKSEGMTQEEEHLSSKHKTHSSNSTTAKKKKRENL